MDGYFGARQVLWRQGFGILRSGVSDGIGREVLPFGVGGIAVAVSMLVCDFQLSAS